MLLNNDAIAVFDVILHFFILDVLYNSAVTVLYVDSLVPICNLDSLHRLWSRGRFRTSRLSLRTTHVLARIAVALGLQVRLSLRFARWSLRHLLSRSLFARNSGSH